MKEKRTNDTNDFIDGLMCKYVRGGLRKDNNYQQNTAQKTKDLICIFDINEKNSKEGKFT